MYRPHCLSSASPPATLLLPRTDTRAVRIWEGCKEQGLWGAEVSGETRWLSRPGVGASRQGGVRGSPGCRTLPRHGSCRPCGLLPPGPLTAHPSPGVNSPLVQPSPQYWETRFSELWGLRPHSCWNPCYTMDLYSPGIYTIHPHCYWWEQPLPHVLIPQEPVQVTRFVQDWPRDSCS